MAITITSTSTILILRPLVINIFLSVTPLPFPSVLAILGEVTHSVDSNGSGVADFLLYEFSSSSNSSSCDEFSSREREILWFLW